MTASLLLDDTVELIDKSISATSRLASGFDFGEGEPDQATIGSLYLDGEAVTGDRTNNRQMQLPLNVYGINATDVTATIDAIRRIVNKATFKLQWTPDGGLPVVFDCFRGTGTRVRNPDIESTGLGNLVLAFPAKPFGRSPGVTSISAAGTATQLDNFDAARTGSTLDNTQHFEGSGSAKIALTRTGTPGARVYGTSTPLSRTYASAANLTGMVAVTARVMWPAPGAAATMMFTLTLTSAAGNAVVVASKAFNNGDGAWKLVTFPLSGNLGTLDLTAVTGYTLTMTSTAIPAGTTPSNLWVDDQRMQPPSSALTSTTHGVNLLLPATLGSARAPANLALSTGGTFGQFLLHSPPVDQDPDAQILTALNAGLADQTVTIPAAGANLRGTFSLVLGGATDGTGATMTVTITQKENGTTVGVPLVLSKVWDITTQGLLCPVGEVTLPLYDTPADNSLTSYTIRVNITLGTDRFSEVMLADTAGQTILTDAATPSTGVAVYVDEPSPLQSGPSVYISASDRTAAWSKLAECVMSGGPVLLEPGSNKLLVWTEAGTPSVSATYYPRWLDERVA